LDRAQAAVEVGDLDEAAELYQRLFDKLDRLSDRILSRRPGLREMHYQAGMELAELRHDQGRFSTAIDVKERLLKSDPDKAGELRRDLAVLRLAKGETERGLAELRLLADEKPEDAWNWIVLGSEARIEGQFSLSESALDRALAVAGKGNGPLLDSVYYHRFLLFRDMRRIDAALDAWQKALAASKDSAQRRDTVDQVYTMLTEAGRYSEALAYVDRDDNPLRSGFQRGLVASFTGNVVKARAEWEAVAKLDPLAFDAGHESWIDATLRLGDPKPVLDRMQPLVEGYETPRLLVLIGIAAAMRAALDLASMFFQRAIELQRYGRPPKQKLDSAEWRLLDSLVTDDKIKTSLRPYFAVIERVWG
jgi:tetratricopeptide (TPR) repeat protein